MDYSSLRERRLSLARGKEGEGERGGKRVRETEDEQREVINKTLAAPQRKKMG